MNTAAPHARPVIALAIASATAVLMGGCGDTVLEVRQSNYLLADPLDDRRSAQPSDHQRRGDNKALRAPLIVGEPIADTGQALPVMQLMKVKIDLLPAIDCENPPVWLTESRIFEFPAPIDETAVASLGTPVRSVEVWVVPASVKGAYRDDQLSNAESRAIAMEALYSGDKPNFRTPFDAVFEFGPNWLGLPLRQAGQGRTVLFPPSQDCAQAMRSGDDRLPTRAVAYGPFDRGSTPADYLKVPADVPFTARIVETCPLKLTQINELRETMGNYFWTRSRSWRFTSQIRGECTAGEVTLSAGPLVAPVLEGMKQAR